MAECAIIGCHRRDIEGDALCHAQYSLRRGGGLAGVGAEEVARRREQFAARIAGCPLERWLARRRPVNAGSSTGNSRVFCSCRCHAAKPLSGSARERHEAAQRRAA